MTRYLPIEQSIFFGNSAADVVEDEVSFVTVVPVVRDEADVSHAFAVEVPGNDIAGLIIRAVRRNGNGLASASEEGLQVRNASMVDARVRIFQPPFLGIDGEIRRHVFVNFFLQVDASVSKRTNDYICTRSGIGRHVAARVRQHAVILSVMCRYLDLFTRAFENMPDRFGCDSSDRRSLECLSGLRRAKRMLKRRSTATAGQAERHGDQYKDWSHIRAHQRPQ